MTHQAKTIDSYLGTTCRITRSRVDTGFGEAKIPSPNGASLFMKLRCDHVNGLKKGAEASVVSGDLKRKILIVESMD